MRPTTEPTDEDPCTTVRRCRRLPWPPAHDRFGRRTGIPIVPSGAGRLPISTPSVAVHPAAADEGRRVLKLAAVGAPKVRPQTGIVHDVPSAFPASPPPGPDARTVHALQRMSARPRTRPPTPSRKEAAPLKHPPRSWTAALARFNHASEPASIRPSSAPFGVIKAHDPPTAPRLVGRIGHHRRARRSRPPARDVDLLPQSHDHRRVLLLRHPDARESSSRGRLSANTTVADADGGWWDRARSVSSTPTRRRGPAGGGGANVRSKEEGEAGEGPGVGESLRKKGGLGARQLSIAVASVARTGSNKKRRRRTERAP